MEEGVVGQGQEQVWTELMEIDRASLFLQCR